MAQKRPNLQSRPSWLISNRWILVEFRVRKVMLNQNQNLGQHLMILVLTKLCNLLPLKKISNLRMWTCTSSQFHLLSSLKVHCLHHQQQRSKQSNQFKTLLTRTRPDCTKSTWLIKKKANKKRSLQPLSRCNLLRKSQRLWIQLLASHNMDQSKLLVFQNWS